MLTVILAALLVFCFLKWMQWEVTGLILMEHMKRKGLGEPTEEEVKQCSKVAVKKMLRIRNGS